MKTHDCTPMSEALFDDFCRMMVACIIGPEPPNIGDIYIQNGQPFVLRREISRGDFIERAHEVAKSQEWKMAPIDARFFEVCTD